MADSYLTETLRIQRAILSRRTLLKTLGAGFLWSMLPKLASGQVPGSVDEAQFVFTRLIYERGDWNTDTLTQGMLNGSEVNLLPKVNELLQMYAYEKEHAVRPDDDKVYEHPFLYMTGHGECDLTTRGRENIKRILEHGGFLLIDNCSGAKDVGFDRAIKGQLRLMFPEDNLQVLPGDHPVFQCFYQIDRVLGGDKRLDPFLEGMQVNGRTAVIYTRNDLGCAWEGHPCSPGGETQRDHAFKMGINIIFYAVSGL